MATRSAIGIKLSDSIIMAAYCHWDGYLQGVGQTLLDNYKTPQDIANLLSLGDMSSLGSSIGRKHSFSQFEGDRASYDEAEREGWTTYYGRDRDESDCGPMLFTNETEFRTEYDNRGAEYFYLFQNNEWTVTSYDETEFSSLAMELQLDEKLGEV